MTLKRGIVLKSPRELAVMREAGKINARALAAALKVVRPGVTTGEVNRAAAEVLAKSGSTPAFVGVPGAYPYPAETTISINDELVHGIPGDRRLAEGDIVSIDCGTIYEGFVGDSALTVGVGEISEEAQKLIRITREALFKGINEMIPGNYSGDVSAAIQAYVEGNGFQVVREYTGHGVGRSMHEEPQVPNYGRKGRGVPLKPGMVIALEPMVLSGSFETRILRDEWTVASKDGRLTAHFEHSVAVTENGPWILTAMDEELDEGDWIRYNDYFAGRIESAEALEE
ncbi:MAG TPA: type I methionyl aminopeptidase [Anaerolineales bacterium]|nr:type I methionyl aminopeptidase [Anaerolineales bacterium]HUS84837.1 type I methionyl aminopeptidase [Anaerolineales bacterium]